MELEPAFSNLHQIFQSLLKSTLSRQFFFKFLNIHYETTIFKAQQTSGKLKPQEVQKKTEEVKIDSKVEEALETAKKVWDGTKPLEAKRPVAGKKPSEIKKPEPKRPEPKRAEAKVGAKPGPSQLVIQEINPLETFGVTSIMVNPELMTKFQDLKARFNSSLGSSLGGMSQGKKAEMTAKKSFLTKLNKKFTSKNIRSDIDSQSASCYAAFKIIHEIDQVINDDQIIRSFFELASKPLHSFSKKDDRTKLYKACFTLNIIQTSLQSIKSLQISPIQSLYHSFNTLTDSALINSEKIEKPDGFVVEKTILNELLKACTKEEVHESISKYEKLDKWRLNNEIQKFLQGNLQTTKSLPGLRVIHSLGCKKGRSFCTFTQT